MLDPANPGPPRAVAILLAGGSGSRMAGSVADKILAPLAGKPLIAHSVDAFLGSGAVQSLVIVARDPAHESQIRNALHERFDSATQSSEARERFDPPQSRQDPAPSIAFACGGAERQDSVWAGLQAVPPQTDIVLIHDCARPCLRPEAVRQSIEAAAATGAACLARRVADTLKSAEPYDGAYLPTTLDRAKIWATETPQTFRFPLIREAYQNVVRSGNRITDDLAAIEALDQPVAFIESQHPNPKLTTPADLPYLEFLLSHPS